MSSLGRWTIAMVLLLATSARGQGITVTAEVSPSRIFQGDAAVLKVRVEGAQDVGPPEVPTGPDYELQYHGGSSSLQSFSLTINGRRVQSSSSQAFTYTVVPTRSGRITIPPAVIKYKGEEYRSAPVQLTVIAAEPQDFVFVELTTIPEEVWIEQPFEVELAIGMKRLKLNAQLLEIDPLLPNDPPDLQIPWLDALDGTETQPQREFLPEYLARDREPGFGINELTTSSGFFMSFDRAAAKFMFPRRTERRTGLDGAEHDYYVYRLRKRYLPTEAGPLTLGSVRFKGSIPAEVMARGQSLGVKSTKEVLAFSKPVVVNVKPVPMQGRPNSYCGAVGEVRLRVQAKPTTVNVGDPITLTLRLDGQARLESVGAPPLLSTEELVRDFKVPENPLAGVMEGRGKVFTQTIRARSEDVTQIPSIELSYFDPDTGRFGTTRSKPIPITVEPGSLVSAEDVIGFGEGPSAAKLTTLTGGIQANISDVHALLATRQIVWSWQLWTGPLLCPLAFACAWGVKVRRDRLRGDVGLARRQKAYGRALRQLGRISEKNRSVEVADAVADCVLGYMADRCNRGDGSMTRQEAADVLRGAGMDDDRLRTIDQLLTSCEQARYAGFEYTSDKLMGTARQCIKDIEKCRF